MIEWTQQSGAWIGSLKLLDGTSAKVVLVGSRERPKGAVVVLVASDGGIQTIPLAQYLEHLTPGQLIEVLCMQERAYGANGLEAPHLVC